MNDTDPSASPRAEVNATPPVEPSLRELDFKEVKKLYHRSTNVGVITFLILVGTILFTIGVIKDIGTEGEEIEIPAQMRLFAVVLFFALSVIGLFMRATWGRIMGIIACAVSLLFIPLGTVIGIFGLVAFFGSPRLFGKNRFKHNELKAEFKQRKLEQTVE